VGRRSKLIARRRSREWTQQSLAAHLHVDESTVRRWELGSNPPAPWHRRPLAHALEVTLDELDHLLVPDALAADTALSVEDVLAGVSASVVIGNVVGQPGPDDRGVRYAPSVRDTLDVVDDLGQADMERRDFLRNTLFAVGASIAPSRDWLVTTIEDATSPTRKVSTSHVEAIRRTFSMFQELDVTRGGGHARHQLANYLTSVVTPLLRSNDASTPAGRALYDAGAEQLYLIGWMAFDDGEHVLAQRYLIQALRLAQEAQSAALGAHVLAGLSDQATLTGHPDHAVQLARAGRAGLQRDHSPACMADLWALQARAEAVLGDKKAVARSVHESERAADEIEPAEEPEWARFIPGAYLHGEYAHAFRDLDRPDEATRFATLSAAEAQEQGRARRGSLAHATLARAALAERDLDVASARATTTVQLAATVQSSRSVEAVADLRARLSSHDDSPSVAMFFEIADALMPALA
jgi:DNA-binding XRE family transcriptional regulator